MPDRKTDETEHVAEGFENLSGKKDRDNDGAEDFQAEGFGDLSGEKDHDHDGAEDQRADEFEDVSGDKPAA